jgi:hypothetical protein
MRSLVRGFLLAVACVLIAYLVWDRVEAWRLGRAISAIAARGEPIDLSSLDAPLPTPQHEEAAQLYVEAAARAREIGQQDFRLQRVDVDATVGQQVNVAELESTYRKDAPVLQLLDRATALPFGGFGDTLPEPDYLNTAGLEALSALSALRSDLLAYRGNGDEAARSLIAAIRIQRTLVEPFTRSVAGARQLGSLRILLRHAAPSEASLAALQQAFAELPDEDGLARVVMLRRARLIEQQADGVLLRDPPAILAFVFHPFTMHRIRVQLEQFPDVIGAAREPWPDKLGSFAAIAERSSFQPGRSRARDLVSIAPPNIAILSTSPIPAGLNLAFRRVGVTCMAIERYRRAHGGALPPALAALVPELLLAVPIDPFTGQALVYKPGPDAYLLYSADMNRRDDGGALYGTGSLNPMPLPRARDFGIKVPLAPRRGAQ